jgi:hypothetical protein
LYLYIAPKLSTTLYHHVLTEIALRAKLKRAEQLAEVPHLGVGAYLHRPAQLYRWVKLSRGVHLSLRGECGDACGLRAAEERERSGPARSMGSTPRGEALRTARVIKERVSANALPCTELCARDRDAPLSALLL